MQFVAINDWILLKINNCAILTIFEIISLKWIKLLTNFNWLETNLYRIELGKACFANYAAYPDSEALAERTVSEKSL